MNRAIDTFNAGLSSIMEIILAPLGLFPQGAQLVIVSLVAGVVLVLLYGRISSQTRLRLVKQQIYASLLEAILFRHDPKVTLRAQARMLRLASLYFCYAVPSVAVLAIPCVILLGQLNIRYGSRPLPLDRDTIVTAAFRNGDFLEKLALEGGEGIEVVTPPVRVLEVPSAAWRIRPKASGKQPIAITSGGRVLAEGEIEAGAGSAPGIVSNRVSEWWLSLLYPGSRLLGPESNVAELQIAYPDAEYGILGMQWHWIIVFFVFSFLSALIAGKFCKVEL